MLFSAWRLVMVIFTIIVVAAHDASLRFTPCYMLGGVRAVRLEALQDVTQPRRQRE